MAPLEPNSADDYDDRTSSAVKQVLVEIGQILGSYQGRFAVIGGSVPWLLLEGAEEKHIGTRDVDLSLDAEALGDGEYASLIQTLFDHGYEQREKYKAFQLIRTVPTERDEPDIDIIVDFLMPRNADIVKNKPPLIDGFAVQRVDGAELALEHYEVIRVEAAMLKGGTNSVRIAVASIPALLAMKGFALHGRDKHKDAYDIYYCVKHYPDGLDALVAATTPLMNKPKALKGYTLIAEKFEAFDSFGPTRVREFLESSEVFGDSSPDQIQQDAFGQVSAWLNAIGLR